MLANLGSAMKLDDLISRRYTLIRTLLSNPQVRTAEQAMPEKHNKRKHPGGLPAPSPKRSVSSTRSTRRSVAPAEHDKIKECHRKAVSALYQAYETLTSAQGSKADDSTSADATYAVLLDGTNGAQSHMQPFHCICVHAARCMPQMQSG